MLDLTVLKQVTDIVCHDNCSDGTMSAILLQDALPAARIHFCSYGLAHERLEAGPNMLFCDFHPHEATYRKFVDAGTIILDHHKSAANIIAAFGARGVFADEALDPGVSGAVLAYQHVWLPLKQEGWARYRDLSTDLAEVHAHLRESERARAEKYSRLIGIRDTWQKHDPDWRRACELSEAVRFFGQASWMIPEPFAMDRDEWWDARIAVGIRLVEKQAETLQKLVKGAYRFTTERGTRVLMFSGLSYTSDACELIKGDADLIVGFDYVPMEGGQAPLAFSTRAFNGFDCAKFCKTYGGGGHSKAAGFSVRFDPAVGTQDPYSILSDSLNAFEADYRERN